MQAVIAEIDKHFDLANGEARRLFHGRGHRFEGFEHLVVDCFLPVIVIRAYAPLLQDHLDTLVEHFTSKAGVEGVVLQYRGAEAKTQVEVVWGQVPKQLVATEGGLKFQLSPLAVQNSGLFLDMRAGRDWVRKHAQGRRVLNLFAYTCGFSVYALAGGADYVVNLDMAKGALRTGQKNHELNELDRSRVSFLSHDLFKSWGKLKRLGPYDLIIIDPPSFQKGSFVAEMDYKKVIRRLPDLLTEHGQVLACHNDPSQNTDFLINEMAAHCPSLTFDQRINNPDEFADAFAERGLKTLLFSQEV